ncbi:MAG TPA: MarR family transcriptional regulator [Methylocella sp.]|nr:MarR family transcriptional regulator [Methylocella sp.]
MNEISPRENTAAVLSRRPCSLDLSADAPQYDLIELMFFAYRDFVSDADHLLASLGFGRAHHRVLHFVSRRPGLTIAELLDILKITKQSLNRVLKELLDQRYVEACRGMRDRRQRHLFPSEQGRALAADIAAMQSKRFANVFAALSESARPQAIAFLLAMVNSNEQAKIAAMTGVVPTLTRRSIPDGIHQRESNSAKFHG